MNLLSGFDLKCLICILATVEQEDDNICQQGLQFCQTAAEKYTDQKTKTDGIYRLRVDKDRNGESGAEVKFNIHWPTLQLSESHEK
jgi:hypothetical protein